MKKEFREATECEGEMWKNKKKGGRSVQMKRAKRSGFVSRVDIFGK